VDGASDALVDYLRMTGGATSRTAAFGRSVRIAPRHFSVLAWCPEIRVFSNGRAIRTRTLGSQGVFIMTSWSRDPRTCGPPDWTYHRNTKAHRRGRSVRCRTNAFPVASLNLRHGISQVRIKTFENLHILKNLCKGRFHATRETYFDMRYPHEYVISGRMHD
jgi:hypothetical protein